MKQPLVSIIVPTRNNIQTLDCCLSSINLQTYPAIELIVVDNNSTDETKTIAGRYTDLVFNKGPERSTQRNFGVTKSTGEYVLIIDSDMELSENVVQSCVEYVQQNPTIRALIIPEQSFGQGFWAQCKQLERSFYVGIDAIEAARFFDKRLYKKVGGYNESLTGGEDWDLTNRIRQHTDIGRIDHFIMHNEGKLYFTKTMRKMYYYAKHARAYFAANPSSPLTDQSGPLARYKLFFSRPRKLFRHPLTGLGMLLLKTGEYVSGGAGLLMSRLKKEEGLE